MTTDHAPAEPGDCNDCSEGPRLPATSGLLPASFLAAGRHSHRRAGTRLRLDPHLSVPAQSPMSRTGMTRTT